MLRAPKRRDGGVDAAAHYVVASAPDTQFFHYFGVLSDACWRRAVPEGTCFCGPAASHETPRGRALKAPDADALDLAVQRLGLRNQPPPTRARVGVVSRRRKRFLLNELDLVNGIIDALRVEVQILPLEHMTLYEQLAALRHVTVLVGVHGSGLNNAIFLPKGACLVQLLPFGLNYRGAFEANARKAGVAYKEWRALDRSRSVFHWEFLGARELHRGKDAVLDRGSPHGGEQVYTFWINQDLRVPVDDVVAVVKEAVDESPLNRALRGMPPLQEEKAPPPTKPRLRASGRADRR